MGQVPPGLHLPRDGRPVRRAARLGRGAAAAATATTSGGTSSRPTAGTAGSPTPGPDGTPGQHHRSRRGGPHARRTAQPPARTATTARTATRARATATWPRRPYLVDCSEGPDDGHGPARLRLVDARRRGRAARPRARSEREFAARRPRIRGHARRPSGCARMAGLIGECRRSIGRRSVLAAAGSRWPWPRAAVARTSRRGRREVSANGQVGRRRERRLGRAVRRLRRLARGLAAPSARRPSSSCRDQLTVADRGDGRVAARRRACLRDPRRRPAGPTTPGSLRLYKLYVRAQGFAPLND